jgi:WASH complex subunit FAM21
MDSYFDKLSVNELEQDDEPSNQEDIIVYETKDPYVLRSLPYLIGSQLYIENDHVGLNDLEDFENEESKSESELEESNTPSVKSNKSGSKIDEATFDKFDELMRNETKMVSKNVPSQKDNESDIFDVEQSEKSDNSSESSNDIFDIFVNPKEEKARSKMPDLIDHQEKANEDTKKDVVEINQKELIDTLNSKLKSRRTENIFSSSDEEEDLFKEKKTEVIIVK